MKRKALGKGLSALLPDPDEEAGARDGSTFVVAVSSLDPNPYQPRTTTAPAKLEELAASIRESGMVQPILVRRAGSRYQIIAGERRFRAAQKLGLPTVPVVVRDVADDQLLELALVENIQREELGPLEEAQAFHRLQEEFHLTQEQVAQKVGRDRSTVANTLRLPDASRRGTPALSWPWSAPRTRPRWGARPPGKGSPFERSSAVSPRSGLPARRSRSGGTRTPGRRRSACGRRWGPASRSAGAAKGDC
jgi:ParB/RepB/Spo0J family partition protein